ncbi:EAL domain-containing protein [Ligilactobacillus faecis]|uniref:EAL domain-containing protein n=1 Tax=Ligilactobacillus faecis TaxID=762833 RepID=UPI0024696307|nr:EAL domain-containing protein [Ligilactobacillus faecis]WGN90115.1 EAL domain-containing protein [Ligilactobacillus faecis]
MRIFEQISMELRDLTCILQPIVFFPQDGTKKVVSYELLIRSKKTGRLPRQLLELVLNDELANKLFLNWQEAELKRRLQADPNLKICLNLAPQQLCFTATWKFLNRLKSLRKQLILEITEEPIFLNSATITRFLKGFESLGYVMVLDDVGTGINRYGMIEHYSMSQNLLALKLSLLKLAPLSEATKLKVIQKYRAYCEKKELMLVIEGVEDDQLVQTLKELRCLQQGNFWPIVT